MIPMYLLQQYYKIDPPVKTHLHIYSKNVSCRHSITTSLGLSMSSSTANPSAASSSQSRQNAPATGGTTATMTVTSPAWSGTSWTGGMAYGCTAALKTTGSGGKICIATFYTTPYFKISKVRLY